VWRPNTEHMNLTGSNTTRGDEHAHTHLSTRACPLPERSLPLESTGSRDRVCKHSASTFDDTISDLAYHYPTRPRAPRSLPTSPTLRTPTTRIPTPGTPNQTRTKCRELIGFECMVSKMGPRELLGRLWCIQTQPQYL